MIASLLITAFPSLHQQIYGQNFNYGKKYPLAAASGYFSLKKK